MFPAKQEFINEKESAINILESQKIDTGYSLQWQAVSNGILHQDIDLPDDQLQDREEEDPTEQDTLVYDTDVSQDEYYSTAIDVIADSMTIQMGRPCKVLLPVSLAVHFVDFHVVVVVLHGVGECCESYPGPYRVLC